MQALELWQAILVIGVCIALATVAPFLWAYRETKDNARLRAELLEHERRNARLTKELFHTTETRVWQWPPKDSGRDH